jgi:two-component system, OmpR family, heavy metal sensor histidine kinase CusS
MTGRRRASGPDDAPSQQAPERRLTWRSLRTRLAAWTAAVVVLTALTTLVMLRQGVTWALFREIDEILKEDVAEIGLLLRETHQEQFALVTQELARKARGHVEHEWFVELQGEGNRPLLRTSKRGDENTPVVDGSKDEDVRVLRRSAPSNSHGVRTIIVGTRLTLLRQDLSTIDRLVVATATVIFALAPIIAYWLAGRATGVLGAITTTASRLRPDHLEERLPVRGTGDELDQLAVTVNGLLDRIAVFLEQKRDTLANAAHELRTPLAAIRSSVEVALHEPRSAKEYQELLDDILDQTSMLQTLLNQLLLLSEAEAERLKTQLECVDLDQLVGRSVNMFQGVAEMRDITLSFIAPQPCQVPGNRTHLKQVVNNLIDNALKYTPAGGRVDVTLRRDGDSAELRIKDTGAGIAPADQHRVFDRFFRADRSGGRQPLIEGSGLGLSICKAVVDAHRGSIRCESAKGQGSQFIVRLPVVSTPTTPA